MSLTETHDPGGKVATAIAKGMIGDAEFYGERQEYRLWLGRRWGEDKNAPFVLWIGMNPSTATADVNDPTITREVNFTKDWSYTKYVTCNVMDYRATFPADLLKDGVFPRSDRNLETIIKFAERADKIICAWGVVTKRLLIYPQETRKHLRLAMLRDRMFCLGTTLSGHPRHPLYLKSDTKPEPYQ